jgi:bifunctional N-acetylglucosamine-1-phosphate-uridyltransferase/glucosamine-1-phosphate-acetyltransferase GlmU-like protein
MLSTKSFFDITQFDHQDVFSTSDYVWDSLKNLKGYMNDFQYPDLDDQITANTPLPQTLVYFDKKLFPVNQEIIIEFGDATKGKLKVYRDNNLLEGASVLMAGAIIDGTSLAIGKGVFIESGALIKAPAIIGDYSEVRQGAYLRGFCLVGKRCVVGHVTEVKHSILLDDAKAGHFAYLGDTILGNNVNLGAGTKMANLRFTGGDVPVRTEQGTIASGLRKFGAILGDDVQTGCNTVTNPGTLLGKKSMVMPNTTAPSGYHPDSTFIRG